MPNGRTGGFPIEIETLRQIVSTCAPSDIVATVGARRECTAAEVSAVLAQCPYTRVAVEEQHHNAYIIHVNRDPTVWVCVGAESSLFPPLREFHVRFTVQHPGWMDWIAF